MAYRKIITTISLTYANGALHLGHMLEAVQADIWSRFQKMRGHTCHYICGSDCHGTPIMLRAQKEGIDPVELITKTREEHQREYAAFDVNFDNFHLTHSPENQTLVNEFYETINANGDISKKTIQQAFDPEKNMFLPDRFIKGTCPKCGADDQYGDNCEVCGASYATTDLKNAKSVLSGATPILKESEHYFFELPKYQEKVKAWMKASHLQKPVIHKLKEWFDQGIQKWDISRDAPYFGFKIPGTDDKYFYVWLDAPIGYLASFKNFCDQNKKINFDEYWGQNSKTELYHFFGKDVMYFHTLFWPATLMSAQKRTPSSVFVHGFLTVNGEKMSKSRGTFIKVSDYLQHFKPDYLRYYFASKLNNTVEDLDLNLEDFRLKVNADLVGKLINIASRTAGFIHKHFDGKLSAKLDNKKLLESIQKHSKAIAAEYESRQFAQAMKLIMRLTDDVNQYISDAEPWVLIKNEKQKTKAHQVCSTAINAFRLLMIYLQPVIPNLSDKASEFLNVKRFIWRDKVSLLRSHSINKFKPMLTRLEQDDIAKLATPATTTAHETPVTAAASLQPPLKPEITFEDFAKVDLRVAKIIEANAVKGADKLIQLKVSLGSEQRQIFAGIKSQFKPEDVVGKNVVIVANLKPRKMRFGLSEGMMILASSADDKTLTLLSCDAKPGSNVQ